MELVSPADPAWTNLVRASADATAFHHPAWSAALSQTYGYPAHVLAWRDRSGFMRGGLPVLRVGKRLVALPFTDHCAPVLSDATEIEGFVAELRSWRDLKLEVRAGLPAMNGHTYIAGTRHVLNLDPGPDALFQRLHRTWKKRIRSASQLAVEVTLSQSPDQLSEFYRLHCATRRRQGVPVQPKRFIEQVWRHVLEPGLGFLLTAHAGGTAVAAALCLSWNRGLIYKYGASDQSRWALGANFLLHWTAIEWACRRGFQTYDLGRTDLGHDSLRRFKAGWGADEIPLVYTTFGVMSPRLGGGVTRAAVARVIRHSPTAVCRVLGELLYRYAA